MDDKNSDKYQIDLLKEVDFVLPCDESAKFSDSTSSDDEEGNEREEQSCNDLEQSDVVDFNSVLRNILSLSNDFEQSTKQNKVPEKEMKNCIEAVWKLEACIQQANSAMFHEKILRTKQITLLHDCYRPKK